MDIRILDELDKEEIDSHIDSKIYKDEVHGMKFNSKGKLEVYNGEEWIELKGGGLPVNIARNVNVYGLGDKMVELRWEDPDDVVVDGEIVAKWKSTKIVRKQGSKPKNDEDGVLVGQSSIRNQYKDNSFIDTQGLINDTEYYYGIFPESEDEIVTVSEENIVKVTPSGELYGFEVDEENLNPATAVTYIQNNTNFTPARVIDGKIDWGSWEEFVKDISYRVVVKNGVEQYKVQYDDATKKLDGSPAVLSGTDGDLFTKFKLLYRKYTKTTKGYKIELSDKPFTGARSLVAELEDGYNQFSNPIMIMLQDLYLLLFKDRDSQSALGVGFVNKNSSNALSGGTNRAGYIFGEQTGKRQMCFLGIENLWGTKYQWVDGLVSDSNYNLKVATKNFNDDGDGYTTIKTLNTETINGYFKSIVGGDGGYVLADNGVASSTTGYCDIGHLEDRKVAYLGGHREFGSGSGIFKTSLFNNSNFSHDNNGSRLCFKNTEGVYVGAYLGVVRGDRLRSWSGTFPKGEKTISEFRTYAQNNNKEE